MKVMSVLPTVLVQLRGGTLDLDIVDSPGGEIVIATYGTLTGTFGTTNNLPADCSIDYDFNSEKKIVLIAPRKYPGTVLIVR